MSTHQTSPLAYSAQNVQYSTPPPFSSPIPSHGGNRNLTNHPVFKRPLSSPTTPLTARPPPRPRPMIAQHFITSTPPPPIRGSSTNAPVTTSQQRGQYSRYNNGQFYKTWVLRRFLSCLEAHTSLSCFVYYTGDSLFLGWWIYLSRWTS